MKKYIKKYTSVLALIALVLVMVLPETSWAGSAVMPWDGPLEKVKNSITGPFAAALSLIGVVVAGAMLIFGGEMGEFARKMVMIVLVLSLIVGASAIISTLYGSSGAVIAALSILSVG